VLDDVRRHDVVEAWLIGQHVRQAASSEHDVDIDDRLRSDPGLAGVMAAQLLGGAIIGEPDVARRRGHGRPIERADLETRHRRHVDVAQQQGSATRG